MPDRWFVVPLVPIYDDGVRPKYKNEPGIIKNSGHWHDFSADKWSDLPWYPDPMYVVRFYADRNKELNDVEKYDDVWSERDTSEQEIADYLNDKYDVNRTYTEWEQRFFGTI